MSQASALRRCSIPQRSDRHNTDSVARYGRCRKDAIASSPWRRAPLRMERHPARHSRQRSRRKEGRRRQSSPCRPSGTGPTNELLAPAFGGMAYRGRAGESGDREPLVRGSLSFAGLTVPGLCVVIGSVSEAIPGASCYDRWAEPASLPKTIRHFCGHGTGECNLPPRMESTGQSAKRPR